eukprot:gene25-7083_t
MEHHRCEKAKSTAPPRHRFEHAVAADDISVWRKETTGSCARAKGTYIAAERLDADEY